MDQNAIYQPLYADSHALVIGIDRYQSVGPLSFAKNDAVAVAEMLTSKFSFPAENVALLTDEHATRSEIMAAFMRFADSERVGPDDRIFVFYAGHGHTVPGRRGETGFLVPVDGSVDDLSSLVRWDELTRNADLISAKHVFFLMDACYGGLALTRKSIPPGSMRLLNDMLQRYSRQVLTAGKADELVSDGGGVRPGHSIFTSHVLDALEGAASATEGVITANGVMSYVYQKVGSDQLSQQTPHYGFLEGDGDFIFVPLIAALGAPNEPALLVQTPTFIEPERANNRTTFADNIKQLLGNPADKIRLDDFISATLRIAVQQLTIDKFPVSGSYSEAEFAERLKSYEDITSELEVAVILLARWAQPEQLKLLERILARISEVDRGQSGLVAWLRLGWYPTFRLMYAAGITALSEGRYDSLKSVLLAPIQRDSMGASEKSKPLIVPAVDAMTALLENFKGLPGFERHYTPRSDYLFQSMQAVIEDQLFLGQSYEMNFDKFEVLLALVYADQTSDESLSNVWGPVGRFGWKQGRLAGGQSQIAEIMKEAQSEGLLWGPIQAGLVRRDPNRFETIARTYNERVARSGWY